MRPLNQYPSTGPAKMLPWDLANEANQHPLYDAFWKERAAFEQLDKIKIPVFSIGIWAKVELHLQGNIVGYQRVNAPKKLLITGSPNVFQAAADFNSVAFHEKYLLPFYDWCLKGQQTSYVNEPAVRYHLMGANTIKTADNWPPESITYRSYYLKKGPTGSVKSLNDGALDIAPPGPDGGETVFNYPDTAWRAGVVTFGPQGPDTVARIITFTSAPLEDDLEVVGPIKLVLHAASSNTDTDFIVKLSEQFPQVAAEQGKVQPRFRVVSKGWMKASHRELNEQMSTEFAPWYTHARAEPLEPGKSYTFEVPVMPTANLFKKGSRIRLELANGDSAITDFVFEHVYLPSKIGKDTIFHSAAQPSQLLLPVVTSHRAERLRLSTGLVASSSGHFIADVARRRCGCGIPGEQGRQENVRWKRDFATSMAPSYRQAKPKSRSSTEASPAERASMTSRAASVTSSSSSMSTLLGSIAP